MASRSRAAAAPGKERPHRRRQARHPRHHRHPVHRRHRPAGAVLVCRRNVLMWGAMTARAAARRRAHRAARRARRGTSCRGGRAAARSVTWRAARAGRAVPSRPPTASAEMTTRYCSRSIAPARCDRSSPRRAASPDSSSASSATRHRREIVPSPRVAGSGRPSMSTAARTSGRPSAVTDTPKGDEGDVSVSRARTCRKSGVGTSSAHVSDVTASPQSTAGAARDLRADRRTVERGAHDCVAIRVSRHDRHGPVSSHSCDARSFRLLSAASQDSVYRLAYNVRHAETRLSAAPLRPLRVAGPTAPGASSRCSRP